MGRMSLFLLALVAWVSPAAAAWRQASSDHFVIYSEESEKSLRDFATRLERYDSAMRWLMQLPKSNVGGANRLVVYVVPSVSRVRALARDKDRFIAGFYVPRAGASIAVVPRHIGGGGKYDMNSEIVLLHEYAHHFLYDNFAGTAFPAWFSEGFAEFYSTAKFETNGGVGLGLPALHRAYSLNQNRTLAIDELIAPDLAKLKIDERDALYARGWLLTHMLNFEPARKGQLKNYLTALNGGKTGLDAASSAFGDLKTLNRDLERYRQRRMLSYFAIPPAEIRTGAISIRTLSAGEDAVMDGKVVSQRGVNLAEAKTLLPKIRAAAAPFATEVMAQTTLAEAAFDAAEYGEAEAAADRALAVNPKAIDALIYKGRVAMARAAADKTPDPAKWKEARRWLVAANRADPDHPIPLILFYDSFWRAGQQPTANSVVGLVQAHALAPQDRGLRWQVARQYLVDGKPAQARRALAPIAYDPHAGRGATDAAAIIANIDSGSAAKALETLQAAEKARDDGA